MDLRAMIKYMHEEENMSVGDIASAYKLVPQYVYEVLYTS